MAGKYNLCPRCASNDIEETDYEDENGEELTEGRRCANCGWEGDDEELECE